MPDLSTDKRCKELEKRLDFYAQKVRERQITVAQRKKKQESTFNISLNHPYPYTDEEERRLWGSISSYIKSFSKEESQAQVNGHFLWKYKKFFGTPFEKHAVDLAQISIQSFPLSDKDKIHFMEFVFAAGKQKVFSSNTLERLSSFDGSRYPEDAARLYEKATAYLKHKKKQTKKKDKEIPVLYNMFKRFVVSSYDIPLKDMKKHASFYLTLMDKTDDRLNISLLNDLAVRAEDSFWVHPFSDKKVSKKALNEIFAAYREHIKHAKSFNEQSGKEIYALADYALRSYNYSPREAAEAISFFAPLPDKNKEKNKALDLMRDGLTRTYKETFQKHRQDKYFGHHSSERPSVLAYAEQVVSYSDDKVIQEDAVNRLRKAIRHNLEHEGISPVQETLFHGTEHIVNKELVSEVAEIYARSYTPEKPVLNEEMAYLFKNIVTTYDYMPKEVNALAQSLTCNGENAGLAETVLSMKRAYHHTLSMKENMPHRFASNSKEL